MTEKDKPTPSPKPDSTSSPMPNPSPAGGMVNIEKGARNIPPETSSDEE